MNVFANLPILRTNNWSKIRFLKKNGSLESIGAEKRVKDDTFLIKGINKETKLYKLFKNGKMVKQLKGKDMSIYVKNFLNE